MQISMVIMVLIRMLNTEKWQIKWDVVLRTKKKILVELKFFVLVVIVM